MIEELIHRSHWDAQKAILEARSDWSPSLDFDIDSLYDSCMMSQVREDGVPRNYKEAIASRDAKQWKEAIDKEVKSICDNGTFELVKHHGSVIGCSWLFKIKYKQDGTIEKYKARIVAQGFSQRYGVDFQETYAPVAKLKSIRTILALAALNQLILHQMDVETAFLNGTLIENVYMKPPEGFGNQQGMVCKLLKTLYGLKQSPREWNTELDTYLKSQGYSPTEADCCIYSCWKAGNY
jgi:hypothetical protein